MFISIILLIIFLLLLAYGFLVGNDDLACVGLMGIIVLAIFMMTFSSISGAAASTRYHVEYYLPNSAPITYETKAIHTNSGGMYFDELGSNKRIELNGNWMAWEYQIEKKTVEVEVKK